MRSSWTLNLEPIVMNKDLVLREYLAIERTKLANETTLLAYIRTGLYFLVAGSTVGHLIETEFWRIVGPPLIVVGLIIMVLGIMRYFRLRKSIEASKRNVGNSSDSFIKSVIDK
jgi:putative membrane protein